MMAVVNVINLLKDLSPFVENLAWWIKISSMTYVSKDIRINSSLRSTI